MSRDKKFESRVSAYLGTVLPGSQDLLAKLTDAAMRAFEDLQAARPVHTVKRSDVVEGLTQCTGRFSVARMSVYNKVAATTQATMPLVVMLGQESLGQLVRLQMAELDRRLGVPTSPGVERPPFVYLI